VVLAVENLLMSCLLAFVIAYLLGPLVNHIERNGASRVRATILVFAFAGAALAFAAVWITPYIGDALAGVQTEAPKYISGLSHLLQEAESRFTELLGPVSQSIDTTQYVETTMTAWTQNFFDQFPRFLKQFFTVMLLGPFLAFFMVKDGRAILRNLLAIVPNNTFEAALSLLHQINQQIGSFVRARLLEAIIVGFVTWVGLALIHFPFAILLGVFAGLTNLIPYLGPVIGFIPALVIGLVNGLSSVDFALLVLVYLVAQVIDIVFLIPIMVAKIVDLHPVTVIIVIIAGSQILGVLGMIISIPVATTLKVTIGTIYRHVTESRA
jgi:putative permease